MNGQGNILMGLTVNGYDGTIFITSEDENQFVLPVDLATAQIIYGLA